MRILAIPYPCPIQRYACSPPPKQKNGFSTIYSPYVLCENFSIADIQRPPLITVDNPQRPPDELLRWHFKQAVLINMKGVGEPVFEQDFPPGSDMVGEILHGPKAAERMEFELFTRLGAQMEVY